MDLLEQCQKWHQNRDYQKIINTLEEIQERTPEMDSELARAYCNAAAPEDRKLYLRAISLLKPHADYFAGEYSWNFRMGYAHYWLEQEMWAMPYFQAALEARPDSESAREQIERCKACLAMPRFRTCFRQRTEAAWKAFVAQEAQLRQLMDNDTEHAHEEVLIACISECLELAFTRIAFEVGHNGEKHELILTPEGDPVKLFALKYFRDHAPGEVLEHWSILVGRPPAPGFRLRIGGGWEISGPDVQVWVEKQGETSFALSAYCETLLPLLPQKKDQVWWMLTTLTDHVLGEIAHMRYISSFDVLEKPREEPPVLLSHLPDVLREQGLELSTDPGTCLNLFSSYRMEPEQNPDADWRLDTIAGSTGCAPLVSAYLRGDNRIIDDLHADGIVAGFIAYPLDTLREETGSRKIFAYRDWLEDALFAGDGPEMLTRIGGATGLYCGYVDFIAWDIQAVLLRAEALLADSGIPWASFHTFRRDSASARLK